MRSRDETESATGFCGKAGEVQFRARPSRHSSCRPQSRTVSTARATRIQRTPTAATRTLTPQARATATLVLITTRLRVAPPASTRKTVKEPLHLQTRTTNLSSQIVPFRVWQVDNPVAGTPTTRTLQERARTSESCDLSPRRRPPRSACTTRALPETPARSSSRLIVAARVSVTPWVLPEARLRSRPPGRALRPWRALRRTVPTVTVISPVSCGERAVWNQILKYHHLDHDIATDTTLAIRIATIRSALSRVATRVYQIGICTSQHAHLDLDLRPSSQVIVVSHISDHTRRRSLRCPDAGVAQRLLRHT